MVWQYTAYKVWIGVVQCLHKPDKLLLVSLGNCAEHPLASPNSNKHGRFVADGGADAHNLRYTHINTGLIHRPRKESQRYETTTVQRQFHSHDNSKENKCYSQKNQHYKFVKNMLHVLTFTA